MTEIEVFVMVDHDGSAVVSLDWDELNSLASDNDLAPVRRVVSVTVKVPTPKAIEAIVELSQESTEATVSVK